MEQDNRQSVPKSCAIYAQSANPSREGIHYQMAICREYAKQQGWKVADDHVFFDKGRVDFNRRSGLRSLLNKVRDESHPVDIVIVDEAHRFSRAPLEMVSVVNAIRNAGADVRIAFAEPARPLPGALESAEVAAAGQTVRIVDVA